MRFLFQINLIFLIIALLSYIPMIPAILLHPLLGLVQIISVIVILTQFSKLPKLIRKLLTIYGALVACICVPLLFEGDTVYFVFLIGSMVAAIYFTIITYLIYKHIKS